MTDFEYWQTVTKSSEDRWVEDRVTHLNGNGALFYIGGENGKYMRVSPDGMLTLGTYEGAIPHIGEAIFTPEVEQIYDNYDRAMDAAVIIGGRQLLESLLALNCIPAMVDSGTPQIKMTMQEGDKMIEVKQITTDELRTLEGHEGLILQGCGGNLHEWVDGISDMLRKDGILGEHSRFKSIFTFEHDGLTNLLFDFEGAEINVGKLAMWRLQTHEQFGGTWLSDYVPNRLGGFVQGKEPQRQKPDCQLIGEDGNIFNLMGIAARTLRRNGMGDQAKEMQDRITGGDCHSYDDALCVIGEYVNITGSEELSEEDGMSMKMGGIS